NIYDTVTMVARDALILEGVKEPVSDKDLERLFKEKIVNKNYLPERYHRILKQVIKAVRDYEQGRLTKVEIEQVIKNSREFISHVVEHIERKKAKDIENAKIIVKHGDRIGEVIFTDEHVFFIHDVNQEDKEISKARIVKGEIGKIEEAGIEELEKAIANIKPTNRKILNKKILERLREIFGEDMEIIVR
ncbi:hypothetical protein J7K74_00260, partial [Candidatus Woesearchaeota archaeon]|nr:hypothetical protein [Candidatus Woesearchaeota archaeon]